MSGSSGKRELHTPPVTSTIAAVAAERRQLQSHLPEWIRLSSSSTNATVITPQEKQTKQQPQQCKQALYPSSISRASSSNTDSPSASNMFPMATGSSALYLSSSSDAVSTTFSESNAKSATSRLLPLLPSQNLHYQQQQHEPKTSNEGQGQEKRSCYNSPALSIPDCNHTKRRKSNHITNSITTPAYHGRQSVCSYHQQVVPRLSIAEQEMKQQTLSRSKTVNNQQHETPRHLQHKGNGQGSSNNRNYGFSIATTTLLPEIPSSSSVPDAIPPALSIHTLPKHPWTPFSFSSSALLQNQPDCFHSNKKSKYPDNTSKSIYDQYETAWLLKELRQILMGRGFGGHSANGKVTSGTISPGERKNGTNSTVIVSPTVVREFVQTLLTRPAPSTTTPWWETTQEQRQPLYHGCHQQEQSGPLQESREVEESEESHHWLWTIQDQYGCFLVDYAIQQVAVHFTSRISGNLNTTNASYSSSNNFTVTRTAPSNSATCTFTPAVTRTTVEENKHRISASRQQAWHWNCYDPLPPPSTSFFQPERRNEEIRDEEFVLSFDDGDGDKIPALDATARAALLNLKLFLALVVREERAFPLSSNAPSIGYKNNGKGQNIESTTGAMNGPVNMHGSTVANQVKGKNCDKKRKHDDMVTNLQKRENATNNAPIQMDPSQQEIPKEPRPLIRFLSLLRVGQKGLEPGLTSNISSTFSTQTKPSSCVPSETNNFSTSPIYRNSDQAPMLFWEKCIQIILKYGPRETLFQRAEFTTGCNCLHLALQRLGDVQGVVDDCEERTDGTPHSAFSFSNSKSNNEKSYERRNKEEQDGRSKGCWKFLKSFLVYCNNIYGSDRRNKDFYDTSVLYRQSNFAGELPIHVACRVPNLPINILTLVVEQTVRAFAYYSIMEKRGNGHSFFSNPQLSLPSPILSSSLPQSQQRLDQKQRKDSIHIKPTRTVVTQAEESTSRHRMRSEIHPSSGGVSYARWTPLELLWMSYSEGMSGIGTSAGGIRGTYNWQHPLIQWNAPQFHYRHTTDRNRDLIYVNNNPFHHLFLNRWNDADSFNDSTVDRNTLPHERFHNQQTTATPTRAAAASSQNSNMRVHRNTAPAARLTSNVRQNDRNADADFVQHRGNRDEILHINDEDNGCLLEIDLCQHFHHSELSLHQFLWQQSIHKMKQFNSCKDKQNIDSKILNHMESHVFPRLVLLINATVQLQALKKELSASPSVTTPIYLHSTETKYATGNTARKDVQEPCWNISRKNLDDTKTIVHTVSHLCTPLVHWRHRGCCYSRHEWNTICGDDNKNFIIDEQKHNHSGKSAIPWFLLDYISWKYSHQIKERDDWFGRLPLHYAVAVMPTIINDCFCCCCCHMTEIESKKTPNNDACMRPASVVRNLNHMETESGVIWYRWVQLLLRMYPAAVGVRDWQGRLPLHCFLNSLSTPSFEDSHELERKFRVAKFHDHCSCNGQVKVTSKQSNCNRSKETRTNPNQLRKQASATETDLVLDVTTQLLVKSCPITLEIADPISRLFPFMQMALCGDVQATYWLLRANPSALYKCTSRKHEM